MRMRDDTSETMKCNHISHIRNNFKINMHFYFQPFIILKVQRYFYYRYLVITRETIVINKCTRCIVDI